MEIDHPHTDPRTPDIRMGEDGSLRATGAWKLERLVGLEERIDALPRPDSGELVLDASRIDSMDTAGAWLLLRTAQALRQGGARVEIRGIRPEFAGLADMVAGGRRPGGPGGARSARGGLERLGRRVFHELRDWAGALSFVGENAAVLLRSLADPGRIRWRDLLSNLYAGGVSALPITGLLSFLMGVVIAYQAAEQLRSVGANIYIVDLIGISVLREIAPLVTSIIVAGRSGSSFTAQIGTMKVTEEVDALRTLGIPPLELLVLPKTLALVVALPLLTVYADIMGVFGGMIMAAAKLDISFLEFAQRFQKAVEAKHYFIGIYKAPAFAIIIALVGCYQGFQVRGGADSVGRHATISVVQSIFLVIVVDAFFSIMLNWAGL
jgi:phospholipid/cholesterol/gamma-HCH transport system permease protein